MAFNKTDLDNIKSKIPISGEIEKKTKLIKKGNDIWCCCPFHNEKTPSCKINDDYGTFYCFGCGAKGDIFTIYQDLFNYTFLDAVKELSERAGVKINFSNNSNYKKDDDVIKILEEATQWFEKNLNLEKNDCRNYLEKRGLFDETIKLFRLGFSYNKESSLYEYLKGLSFQDDEILKSNLVKKDKNNNFKDFFYKRLIFPIINMQNRVVGFGGRVLDNSNPKYINSPESDYFKKRNILYNLNLAKDVARQKRNLLICEGYMDVISLYQNNIKSVVAPLGTAFTEEQLKLSWRFTNKPTILFDSDEAGKRASYKAALMSLPFLIPNKSVQFVNLPNQTDPDSFLRNNSFSDLLYVLKKPTKLIDYIFYTSISQVSLEDADQKISYDKYLDDLVDKIKDKKIQYFYKREFKSLFFSKIRNKDNKTHIKNISNKITSLKSKQINSFIASAINHKEIRLQIIDILLKKTELDEIQNMIVIEMSKIDINSTQTQSILEKFNDKLKNYIKNHVLVDSVYQLFPYSRPKYDIDKAIVEIEESSNNLNTRLSNLKKINKSLDTFEENSSSLNWQDLKNISRELEEDYKDT